MAPNELTIASILRDLANEYDAAVSMNEIYERVLERRPTSAKHPTSVIRNRLRTDGPLLGWVSISPKEMMPLHTALHGLRFRVMPNDDDIAAGSLPEIALCPFNGALVATPMQFVDADDELIADGFTTYDFAHRGFWVASRTLSLGTWMRDIGMRSGDSLLATVVNVTPRVIRLEREPAAAFRRAEVKRQDRELVEMLVEITSSTSYITSYPDMSVLPAFAKSAWRTSYPGLPWQKVVAEDRRMHLADGLILNMHSNPALFEMYMDDDELDRRDDLLLQEILAFQQELLATRREDAARGLWDGIAPRASSAQAMIDFDMQSQQILYGGKISALEDYTAAIEESLATAEAEEEERGTDLLFDHVLGQDLEGLTQIDDVQAFVERNPEVADATRRLMESLTPEEQRRLDAARTMEDVQQVLGPHLADLLRREPALFVPLMAKGDGSLDTDGSNLNVGHLSLDLSGLPDPNVFSSDADWDADEEDDDQWEEGDDDGEDEDGDTWDDVPEVFADSRQIRQAMNHSKGLMAQFIDHQIRHRKSRQTSEARAADLWLYAEFLSHCYGHSLDMGSYATLDEFLFFFYPRKVVNSSQRVVREFCTSVKQFYAFLKGEEIIDNDSFAIAIWQRRDQAARLVELFDQLDSDAPQFDRMFAHLFAPYTA